MAKNLTYEYRKNRRAERQKEKNEITGIDDEAKNSVGAHRPPRKEKNKRAVTGNQSIGFKNLKPMKKGQTANPKGINQYSYRHDAEATFQAILDRIETRDPETGETQSVSEVIIENLLEMATEKDKWALDQVLDRILPVVKNAHLEVSSAPAAQFHAPEQYTDPNEWEKESKKKKLLNGSDPTVIDVEIEE